MIFNVQDGTLKWATYLEVTINEYQRNNMEKKIGNFYVNDKCPVRNILDRFGDKWSILIILVLGETGTLRFNELHKAIGDVSQKMLTVTLRTLEADGLVKRTVYAEIPPRVEYEITERGKSLLPHIHGLSSWAIENMTAITKSRKRFAV